MLGMSKFQYRINESENESGIRKERSKARLAKARSQLVQLAGERAFLPSGSQIETHLSHTSKKPSTEYDLEARRRRAVDSDTSGKSTLILGGPGVGKSVVPERLCSLLCEKYPEDGSVAITGTTWSTAHIIGGTKIHRWASIGTGKRPRQHLSSQILSNRRTALRLRQAIWLVIDEISRVDTRFVEMVDHVLRIVQNSSIWFGGIKLCFVGDFLQLQPYNDSTFNGQASQPTFKIVLWNYLFQEYIILGENHRLLQEENSSVHSAYLELLKCARLGRQGAFATALNSEPRSSTVKFTTGDIETTSAASLHTVAVRQE